MKSCSLLLALSLVVFVPGCRKSEVDNQPAAEVTETSASSATSVDTAATSTDPTPGGVIVKAIKEKSKIEWVAGKVTRDHNGSFKNFDGWIEYLNGKPHKIAFEIDLNSVEADDPKLTGHLKSPDFFDVAQYPKATFVSTALIDAPAGSPEGVTHELKGVLDLHGVKKDVTIPVVTSVTPEGVRTTSQFTINRHDWGISYKGAADDLIRDNVLLKLDLSFPPPPATT